MTQDGARSRMRTVVATGFARLQDVVYVGLAVLLSVTALTLLVQGGIDLARAVVSRDVRSVVFLLDRTLLTLMVVELLYTVQVSFREHALVAEPFLLVALIAAVRRILIITAEFSAQARPDEVVFRQVMLELALLTALIIVLSGSLAILRRKVQVSEETAPAANRPG